MKSMSQTTEQMADLAVRTALTARNSIMDLGTQMAGLASHLGGRRKPDRLRSVLWFAGGAALAGGVVLLFASPGRKLLRRRIGRLFSGAQDKLDAPGRDGHVEHPIANEGGGSKPRSGAHHLDGPL
jgi:hypothetical protein